VKKGALSSVSKKHPCARARGGG